jgi:HEPN domain-containing protein
MNGPDPADVWVEVRAWRLVALSDRRAAAMCLAGDPPLLGVAAFHCQQAAEKLPKRHLVHAGVDFGKTHDIERLGRQVLSRFPELRALVASMEAWTIWNTAYRYPDLAENEPEPSARELSRALVMIEHLADKLEALGPPGPTRT